VLLSVCVLCIFIVYFPFDLVKMNRFNSSEIIGVVKFASVDEAVQMKEELDNNVIVSNSLAVEIPKHVCSN
jgi:hypothetical protein